MKYKCSNPECLTVYDTLIQAEKCHTGQQPAYVPPPFTTAVQVIPPNPNRTVSYIKNEGNGPIVYPKIPNKEALEELTNFVIESITRPLPADLVEDIAQSPEVTEKNNDKT